MQSLAEEHLDHVRPIAVFRLAGPLDIRQQVRIEGMTDSHYLGHLDLLVRPERRGNVYDDRKMSSYAMTRQ